MHSDSYPSDRAPGLEKDLEPFERAKTMRNIQKLYGIKTNAELAKLLGMSVGAVTMALAYEKSTRHVLFLVVKSYLPFVFI